MYRHSKSLVMNLQNALGELKRRHVYKVAIAYAEVAVAGSETGIACGKARLGFGPRRVA